MATARKTKPQTYHEAISKALRNAITYQCSYYVRPDADGNGWNVTDVEPHRYTVVAIPKLHNPEESELRNQENWPVTTPEAVTRG